jgi:HEAT repeat protein
LKDPLQNVRANAALRLGQRGERNAVTGLIELLADIQHALYVGIFAAEALGQIGDKRAVMPLILALQNDLLQGPAIEALVKLHDDRALEPLIELFANKHVASLATVLGNWGDMRAVDPLIAAMDDADAHVRYYAARALRKLGDPRALPVLERAKEKDTSPISNAHTIRGKSVSDAAAKAIESIRAKAK